MLVLLVLPYLVLLWRSLYWCCRIVGIAVSCIILYHCSSILESIVVLVLQSVLVLVLYSTLKMYLMELWCMYSDELCNRVVYVISMLFGVF